MRANLGLAQRDAMHIADYMAIGILIVCVISAGVMALHKLP